MLNRRQFLVRATIGGATVPHWTVLQECANVTKATSINEAHSHTFIITRA